MNLLNVGSVSEVVFKLESEALCVMLLELPPPLDNPPKDFVPEPFPKPEKILVPEGKTKPLNPLKAPPPSD